VAAALGPDSRKSRVAVRICILARLFKCPASQRISTLGESLGYNIVPKIYFHNMCAFGNSNTVVKLILFNQKIVFSCLNYLKKKLKTIQSENSISLHIAKKKNCLEESLKT